MTEIIMPQGVPLWDVARLKPYENNSRTHSPEQVDQIAASMLEFGFTNPILVDEKDGIIAGHGRLLAAQALGLTEVPVVVLSHLSETQKKAYIIADNQLALNAGWDESVLAKELEYLDQEGFKLELTGLSEEDIDRLLDVEEVEPEGDEDAIPEVKAEPKAKRGDLYLLDPYYECDVCQKIYTYEIGKEMKDCVCAETQKQA